MGNDIMVKRTDITRQTVQFHLKFLLIIQSAYQYFGPHSKIKSLNQYFESHPFVEYW